MCVLARARGDVCMHSGHCAGYGSDWITPVLRRRRGAFHQSVLHPTPRRGGSGMEHELGAPAAAAAAAAESQERRAAKLQSVERTHAATVGRLEELEASAFPSSLAQGRALAVARLCKDAALKDGGIIGEGGNPVAYEEVVAAAQQLVVDFPEWDEAHHQLGCTLVGAHRWDEAVEAHTSAVKINPEHQGARAALAAKEELDRRLRIEEMQERRQLSLERVHSALTRLPGPGGYARGQMLRISSLKGAPQHNGKTGRCLSFNSAKGRWNVELESGERLALKPGNVSLEHDSDAPASICDNGHEMDRDELACADTPERRAAIAAEQKVAGNGAYGTEDWDRALECYANSVAMSDSNCKISAKTYSNLAATLCKLSLYEDAQECAARSTDVDPSWAKGWWRRGVVATLLRQEMQASAYYRKAVELDPDSEVFRSALKKCMSMVRSDVRFIDETEDPSVSTAGGAVNPGRGVHIQDSYPTTGPPAAWRNVVQMGWNAWHLTNQIEGVTPMDMHRFDPEGADSLSVQIRDSVTSNMFLILGLRDFAEGMKGGLASLVLSVGASSTAPQPCREAVQQFRMMESSGQLDDNQLKVAANELLGGDPYGAYDTLFAGVVHLCGQHIWIQHHTVTETDSGPAPENCLAPPNALLCNMPGQQPLALCLLVANRHQDCKRTFGSKMLEP
eukprot:COSAG02_NODE_651_length_18910_cov_12.561639_12_plen_678_part_00